MAGVFLEDPVGQTVSAFYQGGVIFANILDLASILKYININFPPNVQKLFLETLSFDYNLIL